MTGKKHLVFLLYTITFILSLPSVRCRPINMGLPWLTSRVAAVREPSFSLASKERDDDSKKMAQMLAAVDNLTHAIQETGVIGEAKLKKIKANILIQVFDQIREYFSTIVPKARETIEPCVATTGTSCVTTSTPYTTISKPCVTTSTQPHTTTSTPGSTNISPCVTTTTPRTTTKKPSVTTTKKPKMTTIKPCKTTRTPRTTSNKPCVSTSTRYKLWKKIRNPVTNKA